MKCYLCDSLGFTSRKGVVRDDPAIKISSCSECGLVFLSNTNHITPEFYENSGMHSGCFITIEEWLKETEVDDQRRLELVKNLLPNKKLEDLKRLARLLKPGGKLILEAPNSEDALLTLYDCDAFQRFSYWSQHLFLFNANTLEKLALQTGLRVTAIQHYQRYPLSNHLYWLSNGKLGGHQKWAFLDSPKTTQAYADSLAAIGKTDTLIAYLELD